MVFLCFPFGRSFGSDWWEDQWHYAELIVSIVPGLRIPSTARIQEEEQRQHGHVWLGVALCRYDMN